MSVPQNVEIPKSVLATAQSIDELEDWLLANNPAAVEDLRRIRREQDLDGHGKNLSEILKRWPTKS